MAQFRNRLGQFTGAGQFAFHKEGPWDECEIVLNNLTRVPQEIKDGLADVAEIIVEALQEEKESGRFAPNAPSTERKKHGNTPWVDGTQSRSTGEATAYPTGAGTYTIKLSGDQTVVGWVDNGTSRAPSRPLFEQTWDKCEGKVKDAVEALLASAMGRL